MDRQKRIYRASLFGVLLNLGLVALKAVIGFLSGSVSVLTDALNNLTDTFSSLVTLVGTKMARKKPDREHPFGHGRIEYLAAVLVGLIILGVGVGAIATSVPKILKPEIANYSMVSIVVISATVVIKVLFGRYLRKVGAETRSKSLSASGVDALFDALLTFGTLVGAVVSKVFSISIDGFIGVLIALFIIRTAVEILRESAGDVIGRRVDEKLTRRVRERIKSFSEVEKVKTLVLHDYGPEETSGAVKIVVSERMTAKEIARLSAEIERAVEEEFGVKIIVGV